MKLAIPIIVSLIVLGLLAAATRPGPEPCTLTVLPTNPAGEVVEGPPTVWSGTVVDGDCKPEVRR